MDAIQLYTNAMDNPTLPEVLQHVVIDAVKSFSAAGMDLEALKLIRGAYRVNGFYATLDQARTIYKCIKADM